MADSRDTSALLTLVGKVVAGLGGLTHRELAPAFDQLGMPPLAEEAGSKRTRIEKSFGQVPEAQLPQLARRVLDHEQLSMSPSNRHRIEDVLWARDAPPQNTHESPPRAGFRP
ncbi:hypothetical protein [Streptomyces sp. NPDC088261]|uniref:hypothetical protein n=1 Tax=Streptomyces sp. NPDC088261 TaxID=3365851 RepID=UPI0037F35581